MQAQIDNLQAQIDNLQAQRSQQRQQIDKLQGEIASVKNILCSMCQRAILEKFLTDLGTALLNSNDIKEKVGETIRGGNMSGINKIVLQHWHCM